jgi:hypothetical protein
VVVIWLGADWLVTLVARYHHTRCDHCQEIEGKLFHNTIDLYYSLSKLAVLLLQSYGQIPLVAKFFSQNYFRGHLVNALIISELKKRFLRIFHSTDNQTVTSVKNDEPGNGCNVL